MECHPPLRIYQGKGGGVAAVASLVVVSRLVRISSGPSSIRVSTRVWAAAHALAKSKWFTPESGNLRVGFFSEPKKQALLLKFQSMLQHLESASHPVLHASSLVIELFFTKNFTCVSGKEVQVMSKLQFSGQSLVKSWWFTPRSGYLGVGLCPVPYQQLLSMKFQSTLKHV